MARLNEVPSNGWPLLPPLAPVSDPDESPDPLPETLAGPEAAELPAAPAAKESTELTVLVDDLAAVVASLNTRSERVYVDRRPTAA